MSTGIVVADAGAALVLEELNEDNPKNEPTCNPGGVGDDINDIIDPICSPDGVDDVDGVVDCMVQGG